MTYWGYETLHDLAVAQDGFRDRVGAERGPWTVTEGEDELAELSREAIRLGFPWWAPWYGYDPDYCPLCGGARHDVSPQVIQSAVHYIDKGNGRVGQRGGPLQVDVTCYGDGYPAPLRRRRR